MRSSIFSDAKYISKCTLLIYLKIRTPVPVNVTAEGDGVETIEKILLRVGTRRDMGMGERIGFDVIFLD